MTPFALVYASLRRMVIALLAAACMLAMPGVAQAYYDGNGRWHSDIQTVRLGGIFINNNGVFFPLRSYACSYEFKFLLTDGWEFLYGFPGNPAADSIAISILWINWFNNPRFNNAAQNQVGNIPLASRSFGHYTGTAPRDGRRLPRCNIEVQVTAWDWDHGGWMYYTWSSIPDVFTFTNNGWGLNVDLWWPFGRMGTGGTNGTGTLRDGRALHRITIHMDSVYLAQPEYIALDILWDTRMCGSGPGRYNILYGTYTAVCGDQIRIGNDPHTFRNGYRYPPNGNPPIGNPPQGSAQEDTNSPIYPNQRY